MQTNQQYNKQYIPPQQNYIMNQSQQYYPQNIYPQPVNNQPIYYSQGLYNQLIHNYVNQQQFTPGNPNINLNNQLL